MLDKEAIKQRIEEINRRRSFLEDYVGEIFEEFTQDANHYEAALRHLQVAIQACLDIGKHIIASKSFERPEELKQIFLVLGKKGIISQTLAEQLSEATGVRNILVHSYLEIDLHRIHRIIQEDLSDLDKFVDEIGEYLKKEGGEENV